MVGNETHEEYGDLKAVVRQREKSWVCYCFVLGWGFTAQSTQWGHVERGQFT